MKLNIIVPHWQEEHDVMEFLLDSLKLQQGIDFDEVGVIIVYDGEQAAWLPKEYWRRNYPFDIRHLHVEHGGVSAARNAGLDASKADYVMFCDADDGFCLLCGLHIIFNEIEKGFDVFTSLFVEETRVKGKVAYVQHPTDHTFVHGKVFRREYLVENNIRFNPKLTIHEDSYFNILAQDLAPDKEQVKYSPTGFYLWKWRDNSICRHDDDYLIKTFTKMLDSNDELVDEFERRGHPDKAQFYVGHMVLETYFAMNKPEWLDPKNQVHRDKVYHRMHEYYEKHRGQWEALGNIERMSLSDGLRTRNIREGMPIESISFPQWLKDIQETE